MPIVLIAIVRIGRRSNVSYIGVYLVAVSSGKHHIYAAKLSQILVPGYCLRIHI